MHKFGEFVCSVILTAAYIIISGLMLQCLWKWFVYPLAPSVLVAELTLLAAMGLSLFLGYGTKGIAISMGYKEADEDKGPNIRRQVFGILSILFVWGSAWFYHWLM